MREPFAWIELDDEVCAHTFGVGACTAALGGGVVRKCYGTFATCPVKTLFSPVTRTLRYCEDAPNLPRGGPVMFPVLKSVSEISGTVNIAGTDNDLSAFGRRATVQVELAEFPHHDRGVDPYAAERVTGAAQVDEPGYRPELRGTHFAKQRARSPYYTGRAMRFVRAWLDGGVISDPVVRHYVQTERAIGDDGRRVRVEGRDVLDLAGNDRAVAVDASRGALAAGIDAAAGAVQLVPAGIGDEDYPADGWGLIGSEIVSYTRAGDAITLTGRGLAGTAAASHSGGDTFQEVVHVDNWRMDDTLAFLLGVRAKVPAEFLPLADWKAEIDRWMPQVRLKTHLCRPNEGVAALVGELAVLGVSIWWDEVAQKVRLMVNRPPDPDTVRAVTEDASVLALSAEDRQKDRLTEVMFFSVQIDPTKSATSAENYRRVAVTEATEAKVSNAHNDTRVRKVFCRWLNEGADSVVLTLSNRLLNRMSSAPVRQVIDLPAKDRGIGLADVLDLTTRAVQDATGRAEGGLWQVIRRAEPRRGRLRLTCQTFQFGGRYAYATENTRPGYMASTAAQRARGMYACDPVTLRMSNGDEPYRAI